MNKITKHPGKLSKLAWPIAAIIALTPGLLVTPVLAQGTIEEVVVTAQRREQAIQDVPLSITAFSSEDLTVRGIDNMDQLRLSVPNMMIAGGGTTGPTSGNFTMRGIPGVARYLDGVAQTGSNGSLANIVELERIEVLKGPQGTLFGKNAMGGAISMVSRRPGEELAARISTTVGNFDQRQVKVNLDLPVTANFLTKLTYFTSQKDGYVKTGNEQVQHGDENDTVIRFDALWNISNNLSVRFDITNTNSNPRFANADVLYDVNDAQAFAIQQQALVTDFTDAQAFGGQEIYRNTSTYAGPGWQFDSNSYNVTIDWDITDSLSLRSITGSRDYDSAALADLDGTKYQFFEIFSAADVQEWSQEIQLISDGDRLDWVVGLYLNSTENTNRRFDWQFTGLVYPGGPLKGLPFRMRNQITENNREDSSLFFEVNYDLSDRMNLTVGGRYSEEVFEGGSWAAADAHPVWPNTSFSWRRGAQSSDSDGKFYSFTPRFALDYSVSEDIMVYASYAEGFNGGGVNTNPIAGVFTSYTGERLNQMELGVRSMLFNDSLRVNASYFDGTWEDIQVGEAVVPGQITQQNAGEAESSGFELDVLWMPTDNFSFNYSAGWLSTAYTDTGAATTIGLNSRFAFAPDFQASVGGQYDWHNDSGSTVTARLDYGWSSDYVTIQDIRLQKKQEAYGLASGRVTYQPADGDWSYSLWGRNLMNQWYQQGGFGAFLGGVDQGVVARPREFGVTVNMEF